MPVPGDTVPHAAGPTRVLSAAATGALDLFARHNGDADTILSRAGIRAEDLGSPLNELNLGQYCAMFEEAARQTGHGNIGLEFGQQFQPRQLGVLGFAAVSAPTLGAAVANLERHFPAHQGQTSFRIVADGDILWLCYRILDGRIAQRRQDAELSLGMFCNIFREALGQDWAPLEVRFEHPRPDGPDAHERRFGAPVAFARRTNAFAFRRAELKAVMPSPDPYLLPIVTQFLSARAQLQGDPTAFARQLRDEISLMLWNGLPTMAELAARLHMTEAALRRRLRAHGLVFADVLRATRADLALHYLRHSDLSLTEIAHNLGYSELSAFSRAFRSWTGVSPHRYRRTLLAAG